MAQHAIDTLIFDIDDTLYPSECGFTAHRNGEIVQDYMVAHCGFATRPEAKACRDKYFALCHSTMKSLILAAADGALPAGKGCLDAPTPSLDEWWTSRCDFERFLLPAVEPPLLLALGELKAAGLKLVIFTNAPRQYALRVLETLQLRQFFDDANIFGVDDVIAGTGGACKPQAAAFEFVLKGCGSAAGRSIMFEDSMKNIRGCAALGIGTVLLTGTGGAQTSVAAGAAESFEARPGVSEEDMPNWDDAAVDAALRTCGEMKALLPCLWEGQWPPAKQ